ncbi:MAG: UrcA family protein [Hyphomonas sp.]|nr:UrcA family protein [Hyphomonas sp.]
MTRSLIRPLAAIALAASACAPAFAASEPFRMEVQYDRTALETQDGADAQYKRVKAQVTERCTTESDIFMYGKDYAISFCEKKTMTSVAHTIDHPNFTAAWKADRAH